MSGFVKIIPAHALKRGDKVPNVGTVTDLTTRGDGFLNVTTDRLPLRCPLYADVSVTITPEEAFNLI